MENSDIKEYLMVFVVKPWISLNKEKEQQVYTTRKSYSTKSPYFLEKLKFLSYKKCVEWCFS